MVPEKTGRYHPGDTHTPEGWYLTADEAIAYLHLEPDRFYTEIWDTLTKYRLPNEKYLLFYLLSDLETQKIGRVRG